MTSRPKQPKYARNKNILVIGGSGSGKTRFFVKPSIMQMHSSYVITDPKGQLLKETGKMLLHGAPKLDENGKPVRDRHGRIIYEPYRIKVLNTINFSKSMKYNPLAYVRSEKDTIVGNCDSTLFLGGKEKGTLKEISELLGKETIDSLSQSENRGAQTSHGLSYQKLGKELMTQDEIAVMDGGKCILQLRGVRPFFSDKFDITKHPRYRYLSDADKKNVFDVERYMKRRPAIVKPDEPFDMYELNASDLEPDNNSSTKRKEI